MTDHTDPRVLAERLTGQIESIVTACENEGDEGFAQDADTLLREAAAALLTLAEERDRLLTTIDTLTAERDRAVKAAADIEETWQSIDINPDEVAALRTENERYRDALSLIDGLVSHDDWLYADAEKKLRNDVRAYTRSALSPVPEPTEERG